MTFVNIEIGRHEDTREVDIIKYIKENPGRTINQVVKYMNKNGSSKITTLKKINALIEVRELEMNTINQMVFTNYFTMIIMILI